MYVISYRDVVTHISVSLIYFYIKEKQNSGSLVSSKKKIVSKKKKINDQTTFNHRD